MKKLIFIFLLFSPFLVFGNIEYCDNGKNISGEFCSEGTIITDIKNIDNFSGNYLNIFSGYWGTKLNNNLISDYNSDFQVGYIGNNFNNFLDSNNNSNFQIGFLGTNFRQIEFGKIILTQQVKEPYQNEIKTLKIGAYIGKQQMGSGIIFSYNFNNKENYNVLMIVNIYNSKTNELIKTAYTDYSIGNTNFVKVKDLPAGEYYWTAQLQTWDGIKSEIVKPTKDDNIKIYFKIFDGFEPYANGYKFINSSPKVGILNGGIKVDTQIVEEDDRNMVKTKRTLIDGYRWDIFNNVFDIENEKRRMDSFALLGINSETFFQGGSCYGMALSAIMWHSHKDYFKNKYADFNNKIGTGTIWEKYEKYQ